MEASTVAIANIVVESEGKKVVRSSIGRKTIIPNTQVMNAVVRINKRDFLKFVNERILDDTKDICGNGLRALCHRLWKVALGPRRVAHSRRVAGKPQGGHVKMPDQTASWRCAGSGLRLERG